jgi:ABC-2 type transport system permease protein
VQAVVVLAVAALLGVHLVFSPIAMLSALAIVALGPPLFATFSSAVACIVKTRERFMGIGQVLTMPLFFASNAIYPVSMMPRWLQMLAHVDPLTYLVDALRALLVGGQAGIGVGTDVVDCWSVSSSSP